MIANITNYIFKDGQYPHVCIEDLRESSLNKFIRITIRGTEPEPCVLFFLDGEYCEDAVKHFVDSVNKTYKQFKEMI